MSIAQIGETWEIFGESCQVLQMVRCYSVGINGKEIDSITLVYRSPVNVKPKCAMKRKISEHWEDINRIIKAYRAPRGIETNEHRELLIGQKA